MRGWMAGEGMAAWAPGASSGGCDHSYIQPGAAEVRFRAGELSALSFSSSLFFFRPRGLIIVFRIPLY